MTRVDDRQWERPIEMVDAYRWEERSKIITRDVHGVSGLMNLTHFSRLTAEPSTPMHYHTNIMEIHCIVKGRRTNRLYVNGREEAHEYTGGEAFVVFPGECHATGDDARQDPCELYAVQLNVSEAERFLGLSREKGMALCARFMDLKERHFRMKPEDMSLLRGAFDRFAERTPTGVDAGLAHLVCFLYRFLELPPAATFLHAPADARIQRVIDYIEANLSEPMPLSSLAALTGYSLSRFKTRFREETGQTPAVYITARRVERAKEALERTDQSITDIAYNLGWSSGNYFCSVFKKLTGLSPLNYRRQSR